MKNMELVCVRMAEALHEAVTNLQPVRLKIATGEAKGKIAYNYYAPQLYDPRCSVIQALDASGKPIVTLVNYAIHPEVLGNDLGICSPDLIGPLYDRLAKRAGDGDLHEQCPGGMVTADNRQNRTARMRGPGKSVCASAICWPMKPCGSSATPRSSPRPSFIAPHGP